MKIGTDTNSLRLFHCPGCKMCHVMDKRWTITGSEDAPTASPSVLVEYPYGEKYEPVRCHLFIKEGKLLYLTDCTHSLAGKTVPMEDWK